MGEMIEFDGNGEGYAGYLAKPASGTGPGVVVIQEWWGLVPHIKDVADRFAAAGFTALAPDIYKGESTQDPDEAATLFQALNIAETAKILAGTVDALASNPATAPKGKVGVVGFCMGGQLALFAAGANPDIVACVDYYGIHPMVHPNFAGIHGRVLGFFAELDGYASPSAVAALDRELTSAGVTHEFKSFAGANHAFFNDTRPEVYDPTASADSWSMMLSFFRETLS